MSDLPEFPYFTSPQIWHPDGGGPQQFFVFYDHPTSGRLWRGPFDQDIANKVKKDWREAIAEGQESEKRYHAAIRRLQDEPKPKRRTTHQKELRRRLAAFTYPQPTIGSEHQGEDWFSPFTTRPTSPTPDEVLKYQRKAWDASEDYLQTKEKQRKTEQAKRQQPDATAKRKRLGDKRKADVQAQWEELGRKGVPEDDRSKVIANKLRLSRRQVQRYTQALRTKKPRLK